LTTLGYGLEEEVPRLGQSAAGTGSSGWRAILDAGLTVRSDVPISAATATRRRYRVRSLREMWRRGRIIREIRFYDVIEHAEYGPVKTTLTGFGVIVGVGVDVGCAEGSDVGAVVGVLVGDPNAGVGADVGAVVGVLVGAPNAGVGADVGAIVGVLDGAPDAGVGADVGAVVGCDVGDVVGCVVGCCVIEVIASQDVHSPQVPAPPEIQLSCTACSPGHPSKLSRLAPNSTMDLQYLSSRVVVESLLNIFPALHSSPPLIVFKDSPKSRSTVTPS